MGKQRRHRQKLHLPRSADSTLSNTQEEDQFKRSSVDDILPIEAPEDVFKGISINVDNLQKKLSDDVRSVCSNKTLKSELGGSKPIPKKEKLKLRKALLLKKIDSVEQMKKEYKIRNKRKKVAILGDTNPLYDALPDLNLLIKNTKNLKNHHEIKPAKPKGIQKANKRKKMLIKEVNLFKKVLADKSFKENPLAAVKKHIENVIQNEKAKKSK